MPIFSPRRKVHRDHAADEGLRPAVPPQVHCPAENARRSTRVRMLYELRHQRGPDAARDVAPRQRQSEYQHQLPHHQHLWSLLSAHTEGGGPRHRGVQGCCRKFYGESRVRHQTHSQRWIPCIKNVFVLFFQQWCSALTCISITKDRFNLKLKPPPFSFQSKWRHGGWRNRSTEFGEPCTKNMNLLLSDLQTFLYQTDVTDVRSMSELNGHGHMLREQKLRNMFYLISV